MTTRKKTTKRKMRGKRTYGRGSHKKGRGGGSRGGRGMAGSFGHKRLWALKQDPGHFTKRKFVSLRGKQVQETLQSINLRDISEDCELPGYKVLGGGELKRPVTIRASAFSAQAMEKITKAGGRAVVLGEEDDIDKPKDEQPAEQESPPAKGEDDEDDEDEEDEEE
ncbi:MAG: uL15 family ribosomal protein [Candidatus Aenigmarchaeota archaeon]|nr:uL15 family ribosomal protein [Candidatus Aenigmarchaeota archaeon]